MNADDILHFWYTELAPSAWFNGGRALDETIRERFTQTLESAARGELYHWRSTARGRLAEIIVLDQFSRHVFRGTARAFAQDALALNLARELVDQGLDAEFTPPERVFAYMPFMHSEVLADHDRAEVLYAYPGLEENLHYERLHRRIIERFGRYPHRNEILGRASTAEELAFLKEPGSSF
jgi:uncharacterized protein (DUF924 family)